MFSGDPFTIHSPGCLVYIPNDDKFILESPPTGAICTCGKFVTCGICCHILLILVDQARISVPLSLIRVGAPKKYCGTRRPKDVLHGNRNCLKRLRGANLGRDSSNPVNICDADAVADPVIVDDDSVTDDIMNALFDPTLT